MSYPRVYAGPDETQLSGLWDQLKSFVTGTVAQASDDPPEVTAWMAQVKLRGNVAVRDPKTGDLAEKAPGGKAYISAPLSVVNADRTRRHLATVETTVVGPAAGIAEGVLSPIADAGNAVLSVPVRAVSGITGLNATVVKIGLAGLAVVWLLGRKR